MNYLNALKHGFKNLFNFRGTTNRRDHWAFALTLLAASMLASAVMSAMMVFSFVGDGMGPSGAFFSSLYAPVANFLPLVLVVLLVASTSRRLRDAGVNPLWQLVELAPIAVLAAGSGLSGYQNAQAMAGLLVLAGLALLAIAAFLLVATLLPSKSR